MKTADFDYHLPEELIAQYPPKERGDSRLLVFDRKSSGISHLHFSEIVEFFDEKDILLFNDTRVFPARLLGHKESGGKIEVLLVREAEKDVWEAMIKASRRPKPGSRLLLTGGIEATLLKRLDNINLIKLKAKGDVREAIGKYGVMPLPPYVNRKAEREDGERYQTVYASKEGAVAAPTAGLHFTPGLMDEFDRKKIKREMITLHVGPGTFQPVKVEDIKDHVMHEEYFEVEKNVADSINGTREKGGRVAAVGTTVVRALESSFSDGKVLPKKGWTDIFVHPGCSFKVIDCLVTNFHLPKSTLFMLVSAFVGTDALKKIYEEAVREKYRFYSYGDAMLIL